MYECMFFRVIRLFRRVPSLRRLMKVRDLRAAEGERERGRGCGSE